MREMFDINLLSPIQPLDKKFSISKEQARLKRKNIEEDKHKGAHSNARGNLKDNNREDDPTRQRGEDHINIDITI